MRLTSTLLLTILLAVPVVSAQAGTLNLSNEKAQWQPNCLEPSTPPSLASVNSETPANKMNSLVENYNGYADAMQAYMNCVSKEAEGDSSVVNQTIVQTSGAMIEAAQTKVSNLHNILQPKN